MTTNGENISTPNGENVPNSGEGNPAPVSNVVVNEQVSLSKQEYAQLMSNLAVMQQQLEMQKQYGAEARGERTPVIEDPIDINNLNNEQLLALINQQVGQPILQIVMQMSVKEELREARSQFKDFDNYKDQVYQIASNNTSLSLIDAYKLAKANQPVSAPVASPTPTPTPVAPTPNQKPNTPATTTMASSTGLSVNAAAAAALKALQYEG